MPEGKSESEERANEEIEREMESRNHSSTRNRWNSAFAPSAEFIRELRAPKDSSLLDHRMRQTDLLCFVGPNSAPF